MSQLTPELIVEIAEVFEIEADHPLVVSSAAEATRFHGQPGGLSLNTEDGLLDAEKLFIHYLSQEIMTADADARYHDDFSHHAYGDD